MHYRLVMVLTLAVCGGASLGALAENQGGGTIGLSGKIVSTTCVIDTSSRDQTIDVGTMSISQLVRDGRGPLRSFSIKLLNCVLPSWSDAAATPFYVTFDGLTEHGLFQVSGQAKGVGLEIISIGGEPILAGQTRRARQSELSMTDNTLHFQLRLVANHEKLHSGPIDAFIRFQLDYD